FLLFAALGITLPLNAAVFSDSLKQGLECQKQGLLNQAVDKLEQAKLVAQSTDEQTQISGALGRTYYQFHQYELAKPLLEQAYQHSDGLQKAEYANLLGNLHSSQHETKQAQTYYAQAAQLAKGDAVLTIKVALNLARDLDAATHLETLQKLSNQLDDIPDVSQRAELSLSLGEQAKTLGKDGLSLAYNSFEKAHLLSANEKSPRIQTEALDGLASLYEDDKRIGEALRLTREAIALMQANEGRDILFNLEWRQGRLLRQDGQIEAATSAYQRAVEHLEAIRQDIPVDYQNGRSSFRETLEPVYLGLADLLLEQAKKTPNDNQQLLKKARDTVELIKQSELEDFLGSRCTVESARQKIEQLDNKTAIVYPIILPQRLEILVSTQKGLSQFTVPVDGVTLKTQVQKMARNLRNRLPATMATKLYGWLVAPTEELLKAQGIETLVFVPDGALRLIPMAALYDGKQFLIEKYAVATSPGLTLFDPRPLQHKDLKTLLLGMSNPGAVVEKLPAKVIGGFLDVGEGTTASADAAPTEEKRGLESSGTRNIAEKSRTLRELVKVHNGNLEQAMRTPAFIAGMKDQLKLPGVKQEVTTLNEQSAGNTLLLDEGFTLVHFNEEVVNAPFSIVHIASHGIFGSKAESSFLMAYDDLLHIDDLEVLLRAEKFKKNPLELLTLSACQTAEGDDRAPLGFTGVALKANARSAMGTLWPISDEAAFALMTQFYKNINTMSKVKALQQAQLSLINRPEMRNPFYWSPFILVGNWL
ncbi:MAG: CHAT domain-containing protein, partial [Methylococcales bacterium]|nr:CHAT domain-containing protein [Methylococcales bacterium]